MNRASFLERTGQLHTFLIGIGLFVTIGALLVWTFLFADLTDYFPLQLLSTMSAAGVVGAWLCFTIKCPRCDARIVWIAVREQNIGNWLGWVLALMRCPRCNDERG
jgi:hypothetical protein